MRLIAMNVKVQNDLSDTLGDDDVTFERHGFENFENEFLKMKMEELARFCVRNEGKMKKNNFLGLCCVQVPTRG